MIRFDTLRWKNFLSTGDNWTEVHLTKTKSTLIVGQNGAGKSTLLDALSFALFGKPHRNINKPQLVNSINGKQCEVEVEFHIGQLFFLFKKVIKPTKLEFLKKGKMFTQGSEAKITRSS